MKEREREALGTYQWERVDVCRTKCVKAIAWGLSRLTLTLMAAALARIRPALLFRARKKVAHSNT